MFIFLTKCMGFANTGWVGELEAKKKGVMTCLVIDDADADAKEGIAMGDGLDDTEKKE